MATEEILLKYRADISDLQAKVGSIEAQLKRTEQQFTKNQAGLTSGFKNIGAALAPLGAAIAGAFAVNQIVAFGKESVRAFQEAELSAKKLQTAVSVNGGLQSDFEGLLNQSKELQDISIFNDEAIQAAQTMALQFGLTADEVKALTPVLTDFASATGQSLEAATSAVLRGLEGQGRGLKLYGVNVDSAASKADNLASITDQLTAKFQGQAKIIGETGAGAIARYNNQIDELKEQLGEKLEPIFLAVTQAALTFTEVILDTAKGIEIVADSIDLLVDAGAALSGDATGLAERELKSLQDLRKKAIEDNQKLTAQIAESFKNLSDPQIASRLETYTKLLSEVIEKRKDSAKLTDKEKSNLAQDELTFRVTINALKQVAKAREDAAKAPPPSIGLTEEQKKAAEEAAKLQAEQNAKRAEAQKKADDELAQLAVDAIRDDFEQRRQQAELDFKNFEKEKDEQVQQGLINQAKRDELVKARFKIFSQELADINTEETTSEDDTALKNRLADIDKATTAEITALQNAFLEKKDFSVKAQEDLDNAIAEVEIRKLKERITAVEKTGGDVVNLKAQLAQKEIDLNKKKNDQIIKDEEAAAQARIKLIQDIQKAYDIFAEGVAGASNAILGGQIANLEAQDEANKEHFDKQQEEIDESVEKRLITEGQGESRSAELKKKRVESEKKSNEEVKKLKRQQAEIDKLLSIFRIGLLLAEAIAEVNPFKIAAASVQLGVVVATPIPKFKQGTSYVERGKNAIGDDTIPAMLDEGERVVSRTKNIKHWDIYEAIDQKRLDQYIMKQYITPALKNQQKTFEENKQKTFAENISQSLMFNGLTYHEADRIRRKGTRITNEEGLAKTLAKELAKEIAWQRLHDR